jgi:hypothetical protein
LRVDFDRLLRFEFPSDKIISGVGLTLRRYWTNVCRTCAVKHRCTTGIQRRITRWEHEHVPGT